MFSDKYKQELVDEKIDSMKQLDRIEFKQKLIGQSSCCNSIQTISIIPYFVSIILLMFFVLWVCLGIYNYNLGMDVTQYKVGSLIALYFSAFLWCFVWSFTLNLKKIMKQFEEDNDKFLMEHTN